MYSLRISPLFFKTAFLFKEQKSYQPVIKLAVNVMKEKPTDSIEDILQ